MSSSKMFADLERLCARLAEGGWADVFRAHGLNLTLSGAALKKEFARPLTKIRRDLQGFRDFCNEGVRAIEPGDPGRSLLFHALASPHVRPAQVRYYPSLGELEIVENYVYSCRLPSIAELRAQVAGAPLAIVMFAVEYRPAVDTVQLRHADLCFSRTGVSRVGTRKAHYESALRGFVPFVDEAENEVRVIPSRFAPYIAAQLKASDGSHFGPMRIQAADTERAFWVPVHKLFDGDECVQSHNIRLEVKARHKNEKLRRIHLALMGSGHFTGWSGEALLSPPFVFEDGIAELVIDEDDHGLLVRPVPHNPMIASAKTDSGDLVTFAVPPNNTPYASSFNIPAQPNGTRAAPEYVHARHAIGARGEEHNLNDEPGVADLVAAGGYTAKHYVDFTGDGTVRVDCPSLALDIPRRLAGFSIVSPPDFFPFVKQRELMDWWAQSAPPEVFKTLWPDNPGAPKPLSDMRYPPNLTLKEPSFDPLDGTITAIVAMHRTVCTTLTRLEPLNPTRVSALPDRAAGIFAPGWDCSIDRTPEVDPDDDGSSINPGVTFLATYGLGSPFPEDSKLCAALSSFWPAAAPDIARVFEPFRKYATATPLTDAIIGQTEAPPWDGIVGPKVSGQYPGEIEYASLDYGDYVEAALNRSFQFARIGDLSTREYTARTLTMERVYQYLGASSSIEKHQWAVLSFRKCSDFGESLSEAEEATEVIIDRDTGYRFLVYKQIAQRPNPTDFRKILVKYSSLIEIFADPQSVLARTDAGPWNSQRF